MMKKKKFLFSLALLCAVVQGAWAWDGNGTIDNPWLIKTTADLDYIAERVNSGARTYSGKYFKLCNDITYDNTKDNNYTPIGGHIDDEDRPFSGNFDGCGHTISGIRFNIYRNQTGLFGRTGKNAFIHDVILADTRIFAGYDVGGIVGYQYGGTVRNCTVEGTVTIGSRRSTGDYIVLGGEVDNYGGIVGQSYGGKIEYCTSSVKFGPPSPNISGDISKDMNYGGICGYSVGTLNWNLTVGAEIPAVRDGTYGAICGNQDARWGKLKLYNNYYNACKVAGTDNATNVGCHAADVTSSGAASITFTGNGTEGEPYLIHSYTRWRIFACYVNNGNELGSKHWKLTADIKAETMAGRSETNSFQGTFDGNGHTVTVDYKSETPGVAPFSHVKNATIKDLRVAGTINASTQYAGGIVGQSYGSLNLTGCCSSVTINSSVSGDGAHGGLVGMLNGTSNTINACVFDGSFATTNGTTTCGGFIGSAGSNSLTITNSLIKPNSVAEGMVSKTFVNGGTPTITGSYYSGTTNLPANQGEEIIYISTNLTALGTPTANYALVKVYGNGLVHDGKFYAAPVEISGSGSEVDPYIISNADEWNTFASYVNGGNNFSGKFVKLTDDISANMMVGISDANSFQGTFDGNGKTLSVSYDTSEAWTAPFRHVKNAVIKSLHVAGTITTSAQFAGGIVAESHGALSLTNCRSSVAINSSVSGDGTHGGLVSTLSGAGHTVTIDNCIFDGSFATTNGTTNCGGFIGWPVWNTPTIKNSLMKPGSVDAGMLNNTFARWHTTYQPTISNCYFIATDNLPIDQGTQAYASIPSNEICKQQTLTDGNSYYVPCTVNFWTMYKYTGSAITVAPTVTAADGAVLTAGMDYTTNYATVTEKGTYSMTVTGNGSSCFGTKAIDFMVADDVNSESLTAGEYTIHDDVTIDWRIVVSGDVVINIAEGKTLTALKGFEVSTGNSLTINGPGALVINDCDANKSGIGAATAGTVTINGGQVTVTGGTDAAGIGSDNAAQPSGTLTLGWTNADNDFINCSSYAVSSITLGNRFVLDGTTTIATADNIDGKKMIPSPIAGTEADPFIIGSEDDWNDFAAKVNSSFSGGFNGKYVKLTANISVTTMAGSDGNHTFRGIFDGDGHTLTVNYTTDEQYAAPFHYTYGCTIKNLKTAGTINTSNSHAGGVVGRNGTSKITLENVSSSVTINSSFIGSAYHGGLVGYTINASLTGCAFTGKLIGADSHHCGGLLGQKSYSNNSNASFTNCLFAPTEINVNPGMSHIFASGDVTMVTIGNGCYYTTPMGIAQGTRVYTAAISDEINKQVTAVDGNSYYMLCTVSGVKGYKLTSSDITVEAPTVTAADGTVLTAGSDFDYTPTTVNTEGSKTMTVSGISAPYSGSKSLTFFVGDYQGITETSTTLSAGEYKVYDDVTIDSRITISGDVTLILDADKTLTATKGIELSKGNSLTINGDTGILDISGCDDGKSGIGAVEAGVLTVNGGMLNIVGGRQAAAIGGDYQNTSCGTITINGGQVTAIGGSEGAAGIGMGAQPTDSEALTSGVLTLGWTNASDYIYCSGYVNDMGSTLSSISFVNGKLFVVENGQEVATTDNIDGQKIVPTIVLADRADNSEVLTTYNTKKTGVLLNDRTLYADGYWNTLCLPFNLAISQFDGMEARSLTSASISGTTLNLNFSDPVKELQAGTPYIIKYNRDATYDDNVDYDLVNPVFTEVTIDKTDRSYDTKVLNTDDNPDNDVATDQRVRFLGKYDYTEFNAEDKSILLMGGGNTLYYPQNGASIGAFRAYFKIGEDDATGARLTAFNIDFGGDNTTGILEVKGVNDDSWYTMDGRRLSQKPSRPGVYINNGVKVVVK